MAVDYVDGLGNIRRASDEASAEVDRAAMWAYRGGGGVVPTATAPTAAATPTAAIPATRVNVSRTIDVALCLGIGGNGGSSECKGRCEHGGYPA